MPLQIESVVLYVYFMVLFILNNITVIGFMNTFENFKTLGFHKVHKLNILKIIGTLSCLIRYVSFYVLFHGNINYTVVYSSSKKIE